MNFALNLGTFYNFLPLFKFTLILQVLFDKLFFLRSLKVVVWPFVLVDIKVKSGNVAKSQSCIVICVSSIVFNFVLLFLLLTIICTRFLDLGHLFYFISAFIFTRIVNGQNSFARFFLVISLLLSLFLILG